MYEFQKGANNEAKSHHVKEEENLKEGALASEEVTRYLMKSMFSSILEAENTPARLAKSLPKEVLKAQGVKSRFVCLIDDLFDLKVGNPPKSSLIFRTTP